MQVSSNWARGVAKVISIKRDIVTVSCPHCSKTHSHPRSSLGSKEVVAGCHAGFTRARSYAIPKPRARVQ